MAPRAVLAAVSLLALASPSAPAYAHGAGEHAHKAPHGGLVQSVGKFHLELVVKDDGVDVWLLDEKEATLPVAGADGKIVVQPPRKPKQEAALTAQGAALHAAVALDGVDAFVAVASVKIDGRPQSARFAWKRPAVSAPPASAPVPGHDHKLHRAPAQEAP